MPKYAVDINGSRRYWHPNRHDKAPAYMSVTNVTGALPKMGLLYWAANTVARYAVTHLDAWTGLPLEDQYDLLRKVPWNTRDRAGAKGSTVHAVAEAMMKGKSYEVEAIIEPWLQSLKRFYEDAQPRLIMSEVTGYSEKTMTAGTFDLLCKLQNAPELGRVLLDWKTSKGVYEDMGVQLVGGYALGFEYVLDEKDQEVEWKPPDTCMIVHLQQDGYSARPVPIDRAYRRAFLGALEIRKFEDGTPGIGQPYSFQREGETPFSSIPTNAELAHLRSRLGLLTNEQKLELMAELDNAGITTVIKRMTVDDVDRTLGFLKRYDITEQVKTEVRSRALRPMP
jgi:hypothetical protein